jgi:hypothetical protein
MKNECTNCATTGEMMMNGKSPLDCAKCNPTTKNFVVMTNTFPGYWGVGETVEDALEKCREQAPHKGGWVVHEIDSFYTKVSVNSMWGNVEALVADLDAAPENEKEWPPVIVNSWRRGARGKMTLDPSLHNRVS